MAIDLRCFSYIDILQPQTAGFIGTISQGYPPLKGQASLYIEVSPGMDINVVTDIALKRTACTPGIQVVERRYGVLELHHDDQGQVRAAGEEILRALDLQVTSRLKPRIAEVRRCLSHIIGQLQILLLALVTSPLLAPVFGCLVCFLLSFRWAQVFGAT